MADKHFVDALNEDKDLLKKIAKAYLKDGDFIAIELELNIQHGDIEAVFDESPDIAQAFDEELTELTIRKLKHEGSHKIFKVISTLYDVITDNEKIEDGGASLSDKVKASSILAKLLAVPQPKKGDKKGELDELLRQLENET